jgi:hypothetical protein
VPAAWRTTACTLAKVARVSCLLLLCTQFRLSYIRNFRLFLSLSGGAHRFVDIAIFGINHIYHNQDGNGNPISSATCSGTVLLSFAVFPTDLPFTV